MARLIVLNGGPAVGKSTVAARYAADHRFALNLDVDVVRALLGRWDDDAHAAGLLARRLALAMSATHLGGGQDVVVPQLVARTAFLDQLEDVARDGAAAYHEVVLVGDPAVLTARFEGRSRGAARVEPDSDLEALRSTYATMLDVAVHRPHAHLLDTTDQTPAQTYAAVLALVT